MGITKAFKSDAVKNFVPEIFSPKVENSRKQGYFDHSLSLHL
jgi:hypothetical protein